MNFRSVQELARDVRGLAEEVASGVDLVVAIPRSGFLAANLLSLYVDVPVTDVDGLCEGRVLSTGRRYDGAAGLPGTGDRVLVLDDSVNTGTQMAKTRERLEAREFPFDIEYAAVYVSPSGYQHVDHWVEVVDKDRVFEWNVLHHPNLVECCVDIDGVLCRDPTAAENDDGLAYREFLETVEPRVVPSERIGWLVTCRLEKYRALTESWLDDHGIEYDTLVMMDLPDKATRKRQGNHAAYKAEVYDRTGASLFVESDPRQATSIARQSGQSVYCYETSEMIRADAGPRAQSATSRYLSRLANDPISFSTKAMRFLLSRSYHRLNRASNGFRSD